MSQYLATAKVDGVRLKDKYRLRAPYDELTGNFLREYTPEDLKLGREPSGALIGEDIYIDCVSDDMIYDVDSGSSILQAYYSIRTRGRGRIKKMYEEVIGKDFDKIAPNKNKEGYVNKDYSKLNKLTYEDNGWYIFDVQEGDNELWFNFHLKDIEKVVKYIKPRRPYASKTPYSKKFLPSYQEELAKKKALADSYTKYDMPKGSWDLISKEKNRIAKKNKMKMDKIFEYIYGEFGKEVGMDIIKEGENCVDGKYKPHHYIHKIGMFDKFMVFLQEM